MTSKPCRELLGLTICGLVLTVAGCTRGGPDPVEIAPVSGVVTYKGVPVRDAYVKFLQEGCPIVAGGFTDDTGRFSLTSVTSGDGGPVGENKVTISLVPKFEGTENLQEQFADAEKISDPRERRAKLSELRQRSKAGILASRNQKPRGAIPQKYSSILSTPLTCTVEAGQENECKFDLAD
jgi:hypothetical protein